MASPFDSHKDHAAYLSEDCSGQLYGAIYFMLIITTILLALRLYARVLTKADRGWDEFALPVAWLLVVGCCATDICKTERIRLGNH